MSEDSGEMTLAKHLMSHPVRRLTTGATVRDAAAFLLRWGISGAPVVDIHGRPVGVFTLNDIARHVQSRIAERSLETRESIPEVSPFEGLEEARVAQFMTQGIVMVFPEATIQEVVRSMVSQKIHRVFVISETNELLGAITTMDILKWMDRQLHGMTSRRKTLKV